MSSRAVVSLLLRPDCRNGEGLAKVQHALSKLGLATSGSGRVSVSVVGTTEELESAFGCKISALPARPPSGRDFGSPPGLQATECTVPAELAPFVESASIEPQMTRF